MIQPKTYKIKFEYFLTITDNQGVLARRTKTATITLQAFTVDEAGRIFYSFSTGVILNITEVE